MSDENDINKRKPPRRRKKTEGEKEALFLKKLRDFGTSPIDDDEPKFDQGMPRKAIRCAYEYARYTHSKHGRTFNPTKMASRTANITGLSPQQHDELKIWLTWLKDRRYVTREPYQSLILQWALSGDGPDEWSGDETGEWRRRAESDHAARQSRGKVKATREPATSNVAPPETAAPRSSEVPEFSASGSNSHEILMAKDGSDPVSSITSSANSPAPLNRPKLPFGALANVGAEAKEFLKAYLYASDEELHNAALALSSNPEAFAEATSRNDEQTRCVETVFNHFGLPLTGSKP